MRIDPLATALEKNAPLYEMKQEQDSRMAGSIPVYRSGTVTFSDFMDVVNPLQHLPLIGSLYRRATGDEISPAAEVMGGAVFGGPIGAAASAMSRTISDDMAVKESYVLALSDKTPAANPDISIVVDEAIGDLSGSTIALADLSGGTRTPAYSHNRADRYNA